LIYFGGWWLLAVGVSSVLCAWFYTGGPYPLAYNGMGDVFVVLFFGLIAVGGTFHVQAGFVSQEVILLGLACGLVVNNILVVNNYRDIDEDLQANKRTLVVLLGRRWALVQYGLSLVFAGGSAQLAGLAGKVSDDFARLAGHRLRVLPAQKTSQGECVRRLSGSTQRGGFACGRLQWASFFGSFVFVG
jgi:4-hydroxybenzoate polyprenyltransferase